MTETLPYPGPVKGDCQCGCGLFGTLKKPNRAGTQCVRGCRCASCRGRNNRAKGQRKQRIAQKALKIPGNSLGANHEEMWRGLVRVEVKAGGQVHPSVTQYLKMEAQSEASRAYGDPRPFAGVCMPDGMTDGVVSVRLSRVYDFAQAIVASMEEA